MITVTIKHATKFKLRPVALISCISSSDPYLKFPAEAAIKNDNLLKLMKLVSKISNAIFTILLHFHNSIGRFPTNKKSLVMVIHALHNYLAIKCTQSSECSAVLGSITASKRLPKKSAETVGSFRLIP